MRQIQIPELSPRINSNSIEIHQVTTNSSPRLRLERPRRSDKRTSSLYSLKVREKLISKGGKLTLDKAMEIARSQESSQAQLTAMAAETADRPIHLIRRQNQEKETQDPSTKTTISGISTFQASQGDVNLQELWLPSQRVSQIPSTWPDMPVL